MNILKTGLFLGILFFVSCDVVETYTEPYTPPIDEEGRAVLLEEYTGMRCVNCPTAAQEASILKEAFGNKLIVVAVHAGAFAIPYGNFQPDLRCEAGETYFQTFGFAGTPVGTVNRRPQQNGLLALSYSRWNGAIKAAQAVSTTTEIKLELSYQETSRELRCGVAVVGGDPSQSLTLWLVEDNIITPQVVSGGVDYAYVQRHVLRGALNGTWGELLSNITADGIWQNERTYTLPANCKAENCSIVAFVSSPSREVVCVDEALLK